MNESLNVIFSESLRLTLKYIWPYLAILGWLIIGIIFYIAYQKYRLDKAGMGEIDAMSPDTFELFLKNVFEKRGYKVDHVGHMGDFGADLIIEKDGVKTAVQVKHYSGKVTIDAVREAYGAINYYKCDKGAVITNRGYTNQAIELAKTNDVKLWNRNDLVKVLLLVKNK